MNRHTEKDRNRKERSIGKKKKRQSGQTDGQATKRQKVKDTTKKDRQIDKKKKI